MRKSFKQIISEFETYAEKHKVIKEFIADPITSLTANNHEYPLQWIELLRSTLGPGEVRIFLNVYFMVLLKPDNYIKIMSDSLRLCTDFYSYFNDNLPKFGFYFDNGPTTASPVEYKFDDNVCGHKMEIIVEVPFDTDEDNIPIS